MRIYHSIHDVQLSGPTFLTIGNFDGLHRGHQVLIRRLLQEAGAAGAAHTAMMTFDPHPLALLRPHVPLHLLTTPQERLALAGELGVDIGIIQPFTPEVAALSPRQFMENLVSHLGLAGLVVGPDFALGRNRAGTIEVLSMLGEEMGYKVIVLEPVQWGDEEVRSLVVRRALEEGDVAHAARLLDRLYTIPGIVIPGDQRGRTIGVPTANLTVEQERIVPADGVYTTWTWLGEAGQGQCFASATNIGVRPTVGGSQRRIETHLLDFPPPGSSGDLYGRQLTLQFVARLRGEKRFESLDALVEQIRQDLAETRRLLLGANDPANPAL